MRKKHADDDVVQGQGQGQGDGRVTPEDVQQVEFRLSFRGYNERDVDAFLDRVTSDLSSYLDELSRLRGGMPVAPGGGDVAAAQGEAGRIISRAREQAAAIVRQAEQQAAAIRAGASVPEGAGGDTRAAVAPFLNSEREFLQQLGTLVQTHAEEIKQMVMTLRSREGSSSAEGTAPTASAAAAAPAAAPPPPPTTSDPAVGGASAAEIRQRLGEPDAAAPTPERRVTIETATEPAYSSEGAPAGDPRERSLRELFWGED